MDSDPDGDLERLKLAAPIAGALIEDIDSDTDVGVVLNKMLVAIAKIELVARGREL